MKSTKLFPFGFAAATVACFGASPFAWAQIETPPAPQSPTSAPIPAPVPPTVSPSIEPLPAPALPMPQGENARKVSPNPVADGAVPADQPLTMEAAVALALSLNRDIATAVSSLSQAEGATVTARAGLGPTVEAGYTLNRYNRAQTTNFGGQSITIQNQYINQATANVNLPLDLSGVLRATTSQAQFQELAARIDISRVRNDTVYNVKNAFYTALRNQALVKVAESDLQNAVDRLADANLRLQAGTVARFDVLSTQTDVATAQSNLIQSRATLSVSLSSLNNTIGIAVDTPLQIATTGAIQVPTPVELIAPAPAPLLPAELTDLTEKGRNVPDNQKLGDSGAARAKQAQTFVTADPTPPTSPNFNDLLSEALKGRAEIQREDANIAAARKGITVARQSLLPTTSLGYGYTYNPNVAGFGGQKQVGVATFTLNLPLFDSGAARGRVRTANAQVALAETTRRTQIDTVTLDVRQAYLDFVRSQEQITAARQALAQADDAYQLARVRYAGGVTQESAGVSPVLELRTAQQALNGAQSNYVNALFDFNNSRAALDRALGRYSRQTPAP